MLFSVCSTVTVECCDLYPYCVGVFGMFRFCTGKVSSPVSLQLLREWIWVYMRFLVYVFGGFWDGDYVSQLSYVRNYAVVRAVLNILLRNASPKGPMCFRCLMFVCQDCVSGYFCFVLYHNVCGVPVVTVCIYMFLPYVLFVYIGSYLLIEEFESQIIGVYSPHLDSLYKLY